jgi:DNA-binding transcriptional ArsR family regulator
MHALDVIGDPVRRRILELLADGEVAAGEVGRIVQAEFGISQPAVSQHLRVLRETGFATVRPEGTRRLYALDPAPIAEAAQWFTPFERFWRGPLDALGTELARGARARRRATEAGPSDSPEASAHRDPAAPTTPEAPSPPARPRTEPTEPAESSGPLTPDEEH